MDISMPKDEFPLFFQKKVSMVCGKNSDLYHQRIRKKSCKALPSLPRGVWERGGGGEGSPDFRPPTSSTHTKKICENFFLKRGERKGKLVVVGCREREKCVEWKGRGAFVL